jgi:hypothetical protein
MKARNPDCGAVAGWVVVHAQHVHVLIAVVCLEKRRWHDVASGISISGDQRSEISGYRSGWWWWRLVVRKMSTFTFNKYCKEIIRNKSI